MENKTVWFDATKEFPPFDNKVLGYYTIPVRDGKGKETGEIFEYYEIVTCEHIIESSKGKMPYWRDADYNSVNLKYWCEIPPLPK